MESNVNIREISLSYTSYNFRTPLKFGSVIVNESVSLIAKVLVNRKGGGEAEGIGSMPLMCEWAFPDPKVEHEDKLEAMKLIAEKYAKMIEEESSSGIYLHPIDWFMKFEGEILRITNHVSESFKLKTPLPVLASLVAVSPIDAAIHDGFGKVNNIFTPKF